ncbi:restriction endonuclease subunit S [Pseudomonas guariconensis]|uniref:restriction endonuclease subunit S n=1 Tax=Pseudomonas guariconensis TaxID=1288410 RepID=UPI00209BB4EF|nr:restriction endonuclease subunit S [Pseudomonas guariconensis]MCO7633077.1 restriction endonuclease subunit S [Pseudomonas guariconensis]
MSAVLTNNLPLLAGAPNGIKKLRELILELAVRGKLVPQDPSDEPASELLKRIAEEKARSVVAGKKVKQQADINDKEQPFSVPQGWSWVRLGSCLEMINGRAFKPTEWIAAGLPIVRIQNLNKPDAPFNYCDPDTVDDRHVIDTGTILISWSGTPGTSFGAFIWERGKAALNQHIFSCSQVGDAFFDKFLKLAINTRLEELIAKAHGGVGLQHVTKGKLEALTLVLPPLAEQHRIVAKVDELMDLCDRLEARQADAESAHAQLVQALLDSLTLARDAGDFAQSWQRLAEHFHTLFTTESSIDSLKQTLLQLAVMGKLVPQDPSDEPASELLKRISQEKAQAAMLGRGRKVKATTDLRVPDMKVTVPSGWSVSTVGEVTICRDGERVPVSQSEREGRAKTYDYYGASGVIDKIDGYLFEKPLLLVGEDGANLINRSTPIAFMARGKYWVNNHAHVLDGMSESLLLYVQLYFNAIDLKPYVTGTAQPKMNQAKMNSIVLLLPPEAEQHRIVAKVDQLMALCDQLKARLNQARQVHEHLASALVEQAVA